MIRTYQAVSSTTGLLYTWQSATLDYLGTGFPGPGTPLHILQISPEYFHGDTGPSGDPASWHDLIATDFSALPDQEFIADGNVTIGGKVWTVKNFANQVSGSWFGIESGNGLRLGASSIVGYPTFYTSSRTNPRVLFPMAGLIGNNTPVRAMYELAYVVTNSSGYRTMVGLVFENNVDNTRSNSASYYGGIASSSGSLEQRATIGYLTGTRTVASTTEVSFSGAAWVAGCNQFGMHFPEGLPASKPVSFLSAQSSVDGYADLDNLICCYRDAAGITPNNSANPEEMTASRWSVSLVSGVENGGHVDRYPVIKKMRLQAWY